MRQFIIAISLAFFTASVTAQRNIDVLHYKYEIRLSDTTDNISGIATIYFKANMPSEFLELDLSNLSKNGKGMKITDLNTPTLLDMRITASPKHIQYWHENDKLKIMLPQKLSAGENDTIAIEYKGIPADGLIISKNKFGDRTFFSDNWPNRARNWIPCVDDPADKASVDFVVIAPNHYQVISNGILIEETNLPGNKKLSHWSETVELPTKVMVIGVAEFAVGYAGEAAGIPVYNWIYPQEKEKGFYDYAQATEILSFFTDYIGPYPYKKLANVQSKTIFGGMENASAIFYHENSVTGKRKEESLLAHEIAHQWFGNMATEKSFAHLWLSEGFATYLTHIYIESKYGTDSLNNEMKIDRDRVIDFAKTSHRPVVDTTSNYMQLLNANSYQKGSWVLHMLRRQLGDSVFKKSIRDYYETYAGKNAGTKDLQYVFEKVSGKKLEQFFMQWLYTAENPKLDITWKYLEKEQQISVTVKQLQKNVFQIPLQISLVTSQGMRTPRFYKIELSKAVETFLLPGGKKSFLIIPDPNISLLAEISINEAK